MVSDLPHHIKSVQHLLMIRLAGNPQFATYWRVYGPTLTHISLKMDEVFSPILLCLTYPPTKHSYLTSREWVHDLLCTPYETCFLITRIITISKFICLMDN